MKVRLFIALLGLSVSIQAAEGEAAQGSDPESTLARIEFRISKLNSSREHFLAGLASLPPNLKQMACKAMPSTADTIALINDDIAYLDEAKVAATLTEQQQERLATQKTLAANLSPRVECSTIQ